MTPTATKPNRYMLDSVRAQERAARAAFSTYLRQPQADRLPRDVYTCPELAPDNNRPGASDFLACPSLIAGRRVLPRQFDSHRHVINPARLPQE